MNKITKFWVFAFFGAIFHLVAYVATEDVVFFVISLFCCVVALFYFMKDYFFEVEFSIDFSDKKTRGKR